MPVFNEGSTRDFLRLYILKGKSVDVVVLGDGQAFLDHFDKQVPIVCTGEDCPRCADGNEPDAKVAVPVAVPDDDGVFDYRAFEVYPSTYRQLQRADYSHDIKNKVIRVTILATSEKRTMVKVAVVRELAPDEIAATNKVKALDLKKIYGSGAHSADGAPPVGEMGASDTDEPDDFADVLT